MNLYDILEIPQNSSLREIKRAYRKLALKYHPDRNKEGGASDKFKEITRAYKILSDSFRRREYDSSFNYSRSQGGADRSYSSSTNTTNTYSSTRNYNQKAKKKTKFNIGWIVFGIMIAISIFSQQKTSNTNIQTTNDYATPFPSETVVPKNIFVPDSTSQQSQVFNQYAIPTATPEPTVDCTGPDGKHLFVTQKVCDDFNDAWKPTPIPTSPVNSNYSYPVYPTASCSSCGSNAHCSYGSCVCDDGYVKNYSNNQCESCPANSTYSYGSCSCNSVYQKNYTTNVCDPCPANSTWSYGSCSCNVGYKKNYQTGQCDALNCPSNSTPQSGYCQCDSGYYMSYLTNTCVLSQ